MATKNKISQKQRKNTVIRTRHHMSQAFLDARWKEGESGNLRGRPPKGWSWTELIREYGDVECPPKFAQALGLGKNPKWKQVVVAMAYRHAAKGNASIVKTLFEYIDGRAPIEVKSKPSDREVAEQIKREAAEKGIDWTKDPLLVAIISVCESAALESGEA